MKRWFLIAMVLVISGSSIAATHQVNEGSIIIQPTSGLITTESGGKATFSIKLSQSPFAAVKIGLTSDKPTEGTVSHSSVSFNFLNWNIFQTVIVTGVDDSVADGDIPYQIITGKAISLDPNFSDVQGPNVSLLNWDDEGGPAANDDQAETEEGKSVTTAVLLNDTLPISTTFTVTVITAPANGTTLVNDDNSITDTPTAGFAGPDYYDYKVCDSRNRCDTATVNVNIKDVTSPSLDWFSPVTNTQVFQVEKDELVELNVSTSDNVGIGSVLYNRWDPVQLKYVDIAQVLDVPYTTALDTSELYFGWNQVFARAYDASGNSSERQFIWFYKPFRVYMPVIQK